MKGGSLKGREGEGNDAKVVQTSNRVELQLMGVAHGVAASD